MLMANSQSDMEDWVRSIRRAVWSQLGGGKLIFPRISKLAFTFYRAAIQQEHLAN